jgi:hypothetical protein
MLILNLLKSCKNKYAKKLVRKKQKKNGVFDVWFAFFSTDSNSPSIFFSSGNTGGSSRAGKKRGNRTNYHQLSASLDVPCSSSAYHHLRPDWRSSRQRLGVLLRF